QIFRFETQQFISAFQGYAFDVAILSTWSHFMNSLIDRTSNRTFKVFMEP
ncbi:hypothetical protein C2G38_2122496, partial [Gigaspora rosea]